MIALAEKDYETALTELRLAGYERSENLLRTALALKGLGKTEKAREYLKKAVNFNEGSDLAYAFTRSRAKKLLETL
jgi:hypothetical protein